MRNLFLIVAVAALVQAPAVAQDRAALLRQIDAERKVGHTASMEPLLEQLLAADEQRLGSPMDAGLVPALEQLARINLATVRYERAEQYYQRILQIAEAAHTRTSAELLSPLASLVRLYHIAGRYVDAERLLLRSISIRVTAQGPNSPDLAADYLTLGRLYAAQSKFGQGANVYKYGLEILEQNYGLEDSRLLPALDGMALTLREDHQDDKTETPLLRALAIREVTAGPLHPDVAQTLDSLGSLYYRLKRFGESETIYRRSLQIWILRLGPTHAMVAVSFDNLAVTLAAEGKFAEAEEAYRAALTIRDIDNVASLRNLALVLIARDKFKEAEPLLRRVLQVPDLAPEANIATLNDLADVLEKQNRKLEAARLRARAKQMEKK